VVGDLPIAAPQPTADRWRIVRRIAIGAYVVVLVRQSFDQGVPIGKDRVIAWTCAALVCVSIGRPWRRMRQIALDWIPFALVLVAYDYSRGAADSLGLGVNFTPQLDADKLLFFGHVPTEWLQDHLFNVRLTALGQVSATGAVRWYEVVFDLVYLSHYLTAFVLAGVLWARERARFIAFACRFVTLSFAGFITYAVFPAAPPWMAAEEGYLPVTVGRIGGRGSRAIGLEFVRDLVDKGAQVSNLVAAVPSLHAGYATLVAIALWRSVPRWGRPLLAAYPVLMGLALVATGEHYVVDIILGILYALGVHALWNAIERRRRERQAAAQADDSSSASLEVTRPSAASFRRWAWTDWRARGTSSSTSPT